jgi:hypothetical protein
MKLSGLAVVAANILVILLLVGLRVYARGYHAVSVEDAYQNLINRGVVDEAKVQAFIKDGWNLKERLRFIGNPDGFLQMFFVIAIGICAVNSMVILYLSRNYEGIAKQAPSKEAVSPRT